MIALVAILKIRPGMEELVANASIKMAEAVRASEKDCLLYEPYVPLEGKSDIYILEKYTDLNALDYHRKSAHYIEFRNAVKDALIEAPQVTILKAFEE